MNQRVSLATVRGVPVEECARAHISQDSVLRLLHRNGADRLAAGMRRRSVRRGTVICSIGETADIVRSLDGVGCLLTRPVGSRQDVGIGLAGPGGVVLVEDVLLGGAYSATGRALSPGAVWLIPRDDLLAELRTSSAARDAVAIHLANNARARNGYLGCVIGESVTAKIRRLLAYLGREYGTPRVRVTHADIAAMLGASRQQVTQSLHRLAAAGEIGLGYGHLMVGPAAE
jgi:CRP-like cAMP-binding protein